MSTKSSILLTEADEHWFLEQLTGEIVLEFSTKNTAYRTQKNIEIRIPEGSPLWIKLAEVLGWPVSQIENARKNFLF